MKRAHIGFIATLIISLLVFIPAMVCAETTAAPPIRTALVREGALAVRLADVLELGAGNDEAAAESSLGELGIAPQNGWIADYPVTPDIIGELQQALIAAADASRLNMDRDDALQRFYDVNAELGLSVVPYADESVRQASSEDYPTEATVNNYYYNYGPPVVTYYEPPPGYVYLYAWVPFPFWSWGFWFPGFYVLHDFHKTVVIDSRVVYVSNHYRDARHKRVYIVDPVKRYRHSGTVYGVAPPRNNIVYSGSPRVARQALDINRDRMMRAQAGRNRTAFPGRNAPVNTPAVRNKGKGQTAPVMRYLETPGPVEKNDRNKKTSVQSIRIENNRTVQAGRSVMAPRDKNENRARTQMKTIDNKPAPSGRVTAPAEPKNSRPQSAHTNAGQNATQHATMSPSGASHESRAPARVQPQQKSDGGGSHTGGKEAIPQMRGPR